ncbi:Zinc finger BED domain-containing protein DAYSLEEPER [Rhynchospora pubera]|uniref:Zinc finger BED domain-containing protein DAYSLEEPER n=1 Tax=Rhynchospora pubera TaxID=906938 RepID=A0AAV8CR48_9POAL|nr:Zinc finger BED domain-containing protein DAYSLEEPER [Rhynchospora pubera]
MASSSQPTQLEVASASASVPVTNTNATDPEIDTQPKKKQKKLTSAAWIWFDRVVKHKVVNGKQVKLVRAICKTCSRDFDGSSKAGTTHLISHYKTKHERTKGQKELNATRVGEEEKLEAFRYDEDVSKKKLALAIAMHEYPFKMMQHEFFVDFIKSLRPSFPLSSRITCRSEILEIFTEKKEELYSLLGSLSCRLSATMDLWTSRQNKSYMCITVHFIDDNWSIQKRILRFMLLEGRHTGLNLSGAVMKNFFDWNIDRKLFSLTLDNDSANTSCAGDMISKLNRNAALYCGGKYFHVRCATHIINLVVQAGISEIKQSIDGIRGAIMKIKNSPLLEEEFRKRAIECNLDSSKGLASDVSTRWNSTYLMLRSALYFKEALQRMHFVDNSRFDNFPANEKWDEVDVLCKCLRIFHSITELLSGTSYPTTNWFFLKFSEIKLRVDAWTKDTNIRISKMGLAMQTKFVKYWEKSNLILAIGSFLDPRYKMGLIDYYYPQFYEDKGRREIDEFKNVLKDLYKEYELKFKNSDAGGQVIGGRGINIGSNSGFSGDGDDDNEEAGFRRFMLERSQPSSLKSELDLYMERKPVPNLQGESFDLLSWWKTEGREFPILGKIARDVLAIPVSTVASESAFSTGGRVIRAHRSKLDPEIVEALICTQDWVRSEKKLGNVPTLYDAFEGDDEVTVE